MLKNLSSIALAGAMIFTATGCILVTDDVLTTATTDETSTGDGDGDATQTGDGDGDQTGDGDGDQTGDGDGDPASGDGDGDTTGDGDGDTTGDGDGDTTGEPNQCGWDPDAGYYECGFDGEDPGGENPIACPDGMVEGEPCENSGLAGAGCCDANGDNWYCAEGEVVFFNSCG